MTAKPQLLNADIENLLKDNSPLATLLNGFKTRPQQIEMALKVNQALLQNKKLVVEAGTGIGKSLAYLLPAAHYAVNENKKIIVATCTKALQNQLIKKDLPLLDQYFNGGLKFFSLMGSENYLCLRRLRTAIDEGPDIFDDKTIFNTLPALEESARSLTTGLKTEIAAHISPGIWDRVKRESDLCFKKKCPFYGGCLYKKDLTQANQAHILVVNHHVYFSYLPVESYDAVIFDEAHNVEDTAAVYFGFSVSNKLISRLIREVHSGRESFLKKTELTHPDLTEELSALLVTAQAESEKFFYAVSDKAGFKLGMRDKNSEHGLRVLKPNLTNDNLSPTLIKISATLGIIFESTEKDDIKIPAQSYRNRFLACAKAVKAFLELKEKDACFWCKAKMLRGKPYIEINMTPLDIAEKLKEEVFSKPIPFILTSATLAVSGKFDSFSKSLGLEEHGELLLDSPFDYKNNVMFFTTDSLPDPADSPEEFSRASLEKTGEIINACPGGGIFVLCTSLAYLEEAKKTCSENGNFGRSVFFQGQADTHALLKEFKHSKNGVLFGSDTFWQGVDVGGKELSCVIITKLPFASPLDPVESARIEYLAAKGLSAFKEHTLPKAVIQFHQGFGRLIRRDSDSGAVAVLDPRINTRSYGLKFINSVPRCRYTQDINELTAFLNKNDKI